jgi:hypothetical protein
MISNLHLHSRFSDGTAWPEEIALEAARAGLQIIALTDHDTMAGVMRFSQQCAALSLTAVPACEIDVFDPQLEYKSELLAYFPFSGAETCAAATKGLLREALKQRRARLEFYIESARDLFPDKALSFKNLCEDKTGFAYDENLVQDISWSKVDLYLYLKARRCISPEMKYKEFKKRFFQDGLVKKYKIDKPDIATIVRAVHLDGGYVVLPHIGHLWNDNFAGIYDETEKFRDLLEQFKWLGVDGVELYWYNSEYRSEKINEYVRKIAEPQGFFFTYGSDCHGPGSGKHTIMNFKGYFEGFPARNNGV